jgi:hypothetical protein
MAVNRKQIVVLGAIVIVFSAALATGAFFANTGIQNQQCTINVLDARQYAAQTNSSYYVYEIQVSYNGSDSWSFNPQNLQLTTNSSATFTPTLLADLPLNLMNSTKIVAGESQKGHFAFLVPNDQSPSKLKYQNPKNGLTLETSNFPFVSKWMSHITGAVLTWNGTDSSDQLSATILNPQIWYNSGDSFSVQVSIIYKGGISWLNLNSISSQDGFAISSYDTTLPIRMNPDDTATFTVTLLSPNSCYAGDLHLTADYTLW